MTKPKLPTNTDLTDSDTVTVPQKTDGIKPGTYVRVPTNNHEMPFTGTVICCYENGPVPQEQYIIILKLDKDFMEHEGVSKVYPKGLLLCLSTEIEVINEPDTSTNIEQEEHFIERCLYFGWTLTGNLVCNTGQMLYIFEPLSRQEEMSLAVREDGSNTLLYNMRGTMYDSTVTKWLINGY